MEGETMQEQVIKQLKCKRCGHKWWPKAPKLPLNCPKKKCNSPYWNKARKHK